MGELQPMNDKRKRPKMIAHRGCSYIYPENSREAIECAFRNDRIDGVEVDVRLTKDRIPVLMHNLGLLLETKGFHNKRVNDIILKELSNFEKCSNKVDWYLNYMYAILFMMGEEQRVVLDQLHDLKQEKGHFITLYEAVTKLPVKKELAMELKPSGEANLQMYLDVVLNEVSPYQGKEIQIYGKNLDLVHEAKNQLPNLKVGGYIDTQGEILKEPLDDFWIDLKDAIKCPDLVTDCYKRDQKREIYCYTIDRLDQFVCYLSLFSRLYERGEIDTYPGIVSNRIEEINCYWQTFEACKYDIDSFMNWYQEGVENTHQFKI